MTDASRHALPMERTPLGATLSLLALAAAIGVTGAAQYPRAERRAPTLRPEVVTPRESAPTPAPAPPAPPPPPPPAASPTPAPTPVIASPAVTPDEPGCPPRWTIHFRRGSWSAPQRLHTHFASLRSFLASHPRATVLVLGFADPSGGDRDNHALSLRRASMVAASLRRAGVAPTRIIVDGIGAYTATDDAAETDALRRVEVRVRGVAGCHGASEEVVDP